MPFSALWEWIEDSPLAMEIGGGWMFPFFETVHVLAVTFLLGSLLMVDLRLMGLAGRVYPAQVMSEGTVRWTWGAFLIGVFAGVAMFITQPVHYVPNPAFQIKMVLLLLAGVNMFVLHRFTWKTVGIWGTFGTPPLAARLAGGLSLVLWVGVMIAGRWIGHLLK
jgi:hypothetical protein